MDRKFSDMEYFETWFQKRNVINTFIGRADFLREFEDKFESNPSYNLWKYLQSLSGLILDTNYRSKIRDDKKSTVTTETIVN